MRVQFIKVLTSNHDWVHISTNMIGRFYSIKRQTNKTYIVTNSAGLIEVLHDPEQITKALSTLNRSPGLAVVEVETHEKF